MFPDTPRVGVVVGETIAEWQREALRRLAASGAAVEAVSDPSAADADVVLEVVFDAMPPGFAAVERGAPTVGFRVDRIGPSGERRLVVRAVVATDMASYPRTLRRIEATACDLLVNALARVRAGTPDGELVTSPSPSAPPSRFRRARLRIVTRLRRIARALRTIVLTERWSVGMLSTPLGDVVRGVAPQIRWLALPRGRFWADPFPLVREGRIEVLCEGYDSFRDHGYLVRAPLDVHGNVGTPRILADEPHHLSYPYVVEDGASRYIVPEQYQARRVALYEVVGDHLREYARLLDGVAAVDPTIFFHDGRWWMFLSDQDRDPVGSLFLYCADALTGPWHEHPLNPIVLDVRCARPGGTPFVSDGVLYRPGQDCSNGYGRRVAIARIDVLNTREYRETVVAHLAPRIGRGKEGLHTLAIRGGIVLVDGKDLVFDPRASAGVLRRYAMRRLPTRRSSDRDQSPPSVSADASTGQSRPHATLNP